MRHFIVGLVLGALLVSLAPPAYGVIRIDRIYFDSPGLDDGSNTSLNGEWIRITNSGGNTSLTDWKILNSEGLVFQFGPFVIRAGRTIKFHTGAGERRPGHRYLGLDDYAWSNNGDQAKLKRFKRVVDRCSYSGAGSVADC